MIESRDALKILETSLHTKQYFFDRFLQILSAKEFAQDVDRRIKNVTCNKGNNDKDILKQLNILKLLINTINDPEAKDNAISAFSLADAKKRVQNDGYDKHSWLRENGIKAFKEQFPTRYNKLAEECLGIHRDIKKELQQKYTRTPLKDISVNITANHLESYSENVKLQRADSIRKARGIAD
jgi:hypothetical protein